MTEALTLNSISNCRTNQRCEACPINRLENAEDRVIASEAVGFVFRGLDQMYDKDAVHRIANFAKSGTEQLGKPELKPFVIGAVAISVSGECNVAQ